MRKSHRAIALFVALVMWHSPIAVAQAVRPAATAAAARVISVRVDGDIEHPGTLTAADLAALPEREVRARDHGKPEATFTGVALGDVLRRAGAPLGEKLRGERLASYVLVTAADGYRAVFALTELDSAFTDRTILVAVKRNGEPLSATEGPLRIVVPGEKRPARWVRQVVRLTVTTAPRAAP